MSYIGNNPVSIAFLSDQFSGNGTTTAFTMSVAPANTSSVIVAVSGVLQDPSTYSVVGTTLTFTAAPPTGTGNISARYLGIPASGVTTTAYRTVTEFTATASQTTFTPPSYTVGFLNVYRNGVLLGSADYTATNGTTVVLATGCTVSDLVTTESFLVSSVLNAIPNTSGSVSASNLASSGTPSSTTFLRGDMAWTSSTGTGNVVLATSPTLVTPALGTPASGTLTNCTGYPASALPAGSVLQVVSTNSTTPTSFTGTTALQDILSTSITPSSTSNKILVLASCQLAAQSSMSNILTLSLDRNGTKPIYITNGGATQTAQGWACYGGPAYAGSQRLTLMYTLNYLDSPSSTSAQTYKIQAKLDNGSNTAYIGSWGLNGDAANVTSLTLLEIKG